MWHLGARGLSDCVGGSWRDKLHKKISQDWLELDEGDPRFQLLTEEEIAAVIFFYLFSSALPILLNLPLICFQSFLGGEEVLLGLSFASLIQMTSVSH
jgi:hypothetical protein